MSANVLPEEALARFPTACQRGAEMLGSPVDDFVGENRFWTNDRGQLVCVDVFDAECAPMRWNGTDWVDAEDEFPPEDELEIQSEAVEVEPEPVEEPLVEEML